MTHAEKTQAVSTTTAPRRQRKKNRGAGEKAWSRETETHPSGFKGAVDVFCPVKASSGSAPQRVPVLRQPASTLDIKSMWRNLSMTKES